MYALEENVDVGHLAALSVQTNDYPRNGLLLVCEHAGNAIPWPWKNLGLSDDLLRTHYAYDVGAFAVAGEVARQLSSPLVSATFSRLFYDINRDPGDWECVRPDMGGIPIPGNEAVDQKEHALRDAICRMPFDAAVQSRLTLDDTLVSIHSFSPIFNGMPRGTGIGVLHRDGCGTGALVLEMLRRVCDYTIGDNEPYDLRVEPPGTIHRLAIPSNESSIAIEIRNNLIDDPKGVQAVSTAIAGALAPLVGR